MHLGLEMNELEKWSSNHSTLGIHDLNPVAEDSHPIVLRASDTLSGDNEQRLSAACLG